MDDSIDNRVLVKKKLNAEKSDIYPINAKIRSNMMPFWKSLLDGGFISKEKYSRLTRSSEFEPDELAGFIQRQLVETRQSTKALAAILKQIYPKTDIVYVKAGIVSQFRQDFGIIKVRDTIEQESPYILQYESNDLCVGELFRIFGAKIECDKNNMLENLCEYIKIMSKVFDKKLFVILNMRSFMETEQIVLMLEELLHYDIKILFIENVQRDCLKIGKRYIMDKDRCEI